MKTKTRLLCAVAWAALSVQAASAGGFAVRDQSAEFQGMSFAGSAAAGGGGISGMYWNPAVVAYAQGQYRGEAHVTGIFNNQSVTGNAFAGGVNLGMPTDSGEMAKPLVLPSGYFSARLHRDLVVALGIYSSSALDTRTSVFWAGQTFSGGRGVNVKSLTYNPTLAYMIAPNLSIGIGAQVQSFSLRTSQASGVTATSAALISDGRDASSLGFTAGINWMPATGTSIGFGWRSGVTHHLRGIMHIPASPVPPAAQGVQVDTGMTTPDVATLSIRQDVNKQLRLLATAEWSNWSRLRQVEYVCSPGQGPNAVFCPAGEGQLVRNVPTNWHDSWFISGGVEYAYNPSLTVRSGLSYEWSPIRNATERWVGVPDRDRLSASVGATWTITQQLAMDFAYSHVFGVGDGSIQRTESGLTFLGESRISADVVSVSVKFKN